MDRRNRLSHLTGRAAFLVYGLLLGLLAWAVMRFKG
jgi:hypothetical protein